MKVDTIDCIWAAAGVLAVGITFHFGCLLYGIVGIMLALAALMYWHIFQARKPMKNAVAAYGRITGYHTEKGFPTHYYPMITFETEDGRTVDTIYSVSDSKERYETGSEEMICYDPENPMFFYFADRENDFTNGYYWIMIAAIIGALIAFVIAQIMAG